MKINEKYKIATSIWVLSCTDKMPQITYRSMKERLSLDDDKTIKKIVNDFPELFQKHIPKKQLDAWKDEMRNKRRRPKWIAESKNQINVINQLSREHVFRNRFRNSLNADMPETYILNWGIEYIRDYYFTSVRTNEKRLNWVSTIGTLIIAILAIIFSN